MKKLLFFAVILGGLAFTSCSKEECTCDILGQELKYTEDDMEGSGMTLKEFCDAGGELCSM